MTDTMRTRTLELADNCRFTLFEPADYGPDFSVTGVLRIGRHTVFGSVPGTPGLSAMATLLGALLDEVVRSGQAPAHDRDLLMQRLRRDLDEAEALAVTWGWQPPKPTPEPAPGGVVL